MSHKSLSAKILVATLLLSNMALATNDKVYTFGVVPQQSASKLAKTWIPILKYIHKKTGYRLKFKTARTIPVFERRLKKAAYDFSYMNPYHYTVFHASAGYDAFGKAKNKRIKGIIVVRKDSPYKSISELNNKKLAFPSPGAFAATILPQAHMS